MTSFHKMLKGITHVMTVFQSFQNGILCTIQLGVNIHKGDNFSRLKVAVKGGK